MSRKSPEEYETVHALRAALGTAHSAIAKEKEKSKKLQADLDLLTARIHVLEESINTIKSLQSNEDAKIFNVMHKPKNPVKSSSSAFLSNALPYEVGGVYTRKDGRTVRVLQQNINSEGIPVLNCSDGVYRYNSPKILGRVVGKSLTEDNMQNLVLVYPVIDGG